MQLTNLDGLLTEEEMPVCPMCTMPIYEGEDVLVGVANARMCLVHYSCGDVEFFNA